MSILHTLAPVRVGSVGLKPTKNSPESEASDRLLYSQATSLATGRTTYIASPSAAGRHVQNVYDLIKKTVTHGESHSALIIGDRGSGKSTLINSVLHQLNGELDMENDTLVVKLSGVVHHEDSVALKSITAQVMQLENVVGDRVFGTLAENFSFLLSCLQTGSDKSCKSLIFILDEFDGFCHPGISQSLLYNLFDVTHSKKAPMCVIGVTCRPDVIELLEKRVKSRFSHMHIFLYPNEENYTDPNYKPYIIFRDIFVELLTLPETIKKELARSPKKKIKIKNIEAIEKMNIGGDYNPRNGLLPEEVLIKCRITMSDLEMFDSKFIKNWNANILSLAQNHNVLDALEKLCYYTTNEQIYRDILIVSKVSTNKPNIDITDICNAIDKVVAYDNGVQQLKSLSILELSLVIAMKHGVEIFNGDPMNFEMVLQRYTTFANANSSAQKVPKAVVLKAFEHLQALKIIVPVKNSDFIQSESAGSKMQKEYQLYALDVSPDTLEEAMKSFKSLPTEISHWYSNSIV
ncbi:Origin recognition complex subunit 4 [Eumeta japonica]|uniref:Origin recognition complex subunit 4 n=1 Tax=Eumeta variegata TaxID=151549 RepID=A0A4C1ZN55_EUMVA|nr:Origin recognition complex subunit 4 [Eumeta japonica]